MWECESVWGGRGCIPEGCGVQAEPLHFNGVGGLLEKKHTLKFGESQSANP